MDHGIVKQIILAQNDDGMVYERLIHAIYRELVVSGDVCVDGGALLGLHTRPLAQLVGQYGKVFAFEPIPYYAGIIRKYAEDLKTPQVEVIERALASREGQIEFHWVKEMPGYSGIRLRAKEIEGSTVEKLVVEATTLDRFLKTAEMQTLRFIKMDLEGGEFDALKGAIGTFKTLGPVVIFEGAGTFQATLYEYTKEQFFGFFADAGYIVFDILSQLYDERAWDKPGYAYYFVAVPRGSDKEQFCVNRLPTLVAQFAENTSAYADIITYGTPKPRV